MRLAPDRENDRVRPHPDAGEPWAVAKVYYTHGFPKKRLELLDEELFARDGVQGARIADINALAAEAIVLGTGGGLYDPHGTVQRDSMASFLVRTIQYLANLDSGEGSTRAA